MTLPLRLGQAPDPDRPVRPPRARPRGLAARGEPWRSIHGEAWPAYDPALTVDELIELPVQIDGKLRDRVLVPAGASAAEIEAVVVARSRPTGRSPRLRLALDVHQLQGSPRPPRVKSRRTPSVPVVSPERDRGAGWVAYIQRPNNEG